MTADKKGRDSKEEKEKSPSREKTPKPKENGKKAEKLVLKKEGGGGGGWLSWLTTIALVGITLALVVTVHKLNTQIASERKLYGKQIQELEAEASSARTKATVAESEKLDALSKVTDLENQVSQSKAALQKAEVEAAAIKGMLKTNQEVIEAAAKDYGELERKTDQEIRRLKTELTRYENNELETEKHLKHTQDLLTQVQQKSMEQTNAEGKLKLENSQLQSRIQELEAQVALDEEQFTENINSLNEKTAQVNQLQSELQKAADEMKGLMTTIGERDATVLDIQAKWEQATQQISQLQQAVQKANAAQQAQQQAQQAQQQAQQAQQQAQQAQQHAQQAQQQQQQQQPNPA